MGKQKFLSYFVAVFSLVGYLLISYRIERFETIPLLLTYSFLFGLYVLIIKYSEEDKIQFWIFTAVIFRLGLLLSIPNLSDDVFRFIWDGRLLAAGYHPFAELPAHYLQQGIPGIDQALYDKLNSQAYFTIYPPLAQFVFWIAASLSPNSITGSIVIMRCLIIASEVGSIYLLRKLLTKFHLPEKDVLIYAINPLVILELTGNLHFEAFVIFFLLLSLWLITQDRIKQAAISFSLAICTKLLPIIFLPLFMLRIGWKRALILYLSIGICCIVFFLPLWNKEVMEGFSQSIGLYFKKFEFNASLYYVVREYGFWHKGFNTIQTIGWKMGLVAGILIVIVAASPLLTMYKSVEHRKIASAEDHMIMSLPLVMMWSLLIYFLFTTTLHPWYISTLLALSVFTRFRFVMVWTGLIFLTYWGYSRDGFLEQMWITAVEYLLVFGYLVYELIWKKERQYS